MLIVISKPETAYQPAKIDYRGLVLIVSGIGLSVVGFQQSSIWGWGSTPTRACIAAGVSLLFVFYFVELRTSSPLMEVRIFRIRPFRVENFVLGIAMLAFVPLFFFASEYAEIALGESTSQTGLYILYFFLGFAGASQIGGRMLDHIGAKRPVVFGCAIAAVGFYLWAGRLTELRLGSQIWFLVLSGAGMGLMLTPASTDAVNRGSWALLRRGDGHHPDGPKLCRQPWSCHPGDDFGHPVALSLDNLTDRQGIASSPSNDRGTPDR